MSRNFRIALLFSVLFHVLFASVVVIVNPCSNAELKPYMPVNSLGPLLKETAEEPPPLFQEVQPLKRRAPREEEFSYRPEEINEGAISDFLSDRKEMPA